MSTDHYMSTFYSAIQFQARLNPHAIAVSYGGQDVTYAEFSIDIERVTRRLNSLTLQQANPVVVHVVRPYLHWLLLIAMSRIGLVSVSVTDAGRPEVFELLRADTLLTDQDGGPDDRKSIRVDKHWLERGTDSFADFTEPDHKEEDPVRILLSSGTTGVPKKILITYGLLQTRLKNAVVSSEFSSTSRVMTTVTSDTVAGFQMPLATWSVGGRVVLLIQGQNLYRALTQAGVNFLFMSPAQLGNFLDALPANAYPIPSLTILVGGSSLPQSINEKARRRLTSSLHIVYGSTEAASVTRAHAALSDAHPGTTGYLLPWIEVQVVDAAGRVLPHGGVGEVRIRGTGCVTKYLDEPASDDVVQRHSESEDAFQGGWFYPGDAGVLSETGMLSIVGRTRDLINLGGVKLAPSLIEEVLISCPGVTDIAAFAIDQPDGTDRPWVAVVAGEGFQRDALSARYKQKFPKLALINVAKIDRIPRNAMGKVLRNELRALVKNATAKTH